MRKIFWFILLALFLGACAKIVTPTGGPKDSVPPKMVKENPVSGSVRITNPVIKISFDEYFTLNNPTDNILISPPVEQQPTFTVQDKNLVIKFKDPLKPNTTYNMVFSNCIQDFHENNKLGYYHYSFSTGDEIDNHSLSGSVLDALTLAPCDNYFVFLYDQDIDTLPLSTIPSYLTKTLSNGTFSFQNIKPGEYKVFALKDGNGNLFHDLPSESVAFADRLYKSVKEPVKDTTQAAEPLADTIPDIKLYAFVAADSIPVLMHFENPSAGVYMFPYKTSVEQLSITALNREIPHFEIINHQRDTVTWYMKEPLTDTLSFLFNADGHVDTVQVTPYKSKKAQGRGNKPTVPSQLPVTLLNQGHRFQPLTLSFGYPVKPTDSIDVILCTHQKNVTDTAIYRIIVPDTLVTKLELPILFEDKKSYTVIIADSVFTGYNGQANDTIKASFTTKSEKDYGSLSMKYVVPARGFQYVTQLKMGNQVVQENIITETQTIEYKHLTPGSYDIFVVEDRNLNGRWDSGNYWAGQQPERVFKYPTAISIRAYWDNEETFEIP